LVAYSACEAVAKNPGNLSNPVFVYGTSGLGKTHLLHSVGNAIQRNNPSWNILYVTSDDFMNEFIASIRFSRQEQFRQKYRNCDVLLVDDIQFLENKDTTQTEFFHTFNELYQKKKQILITSDKYPKDIPNIEERLKSRFLQGLIADIEPPGFEDRLAILEAKSKNLGLKMDQELAMHIANQVKGSVRELQGVLNTLLMNQNMTGVPATIESANQVLKRMLKINTGIPVDMPLIQKVVSQHFGIKIADMTSKNRSQKYVIPRHVAMYLAKEILQTTTTEIADAFGKKDHTTVMHALTKVKELMDSGPSMKATLQELRKKIEVDG
jgi:chromosomal replication initiator protein